LMFRGALAGGDKPRPYTLNLLCATT
jgi:hypothetical protein